MNEENNKNNEEAEKYEFPEGSIKNFGKKNNLVLSLFSLAAIIIVAIIFTFFAGHKTKAEDKIEGPTGEDVLRIDGNRNGKFVDFDHEAHKDFFGNDEKGCKKCHHLNKPDKGPSSCSQCHWSMEKTASIFDHNYHIKSLADKDSCRQCHTEKDIDSVSKCSTCHEDFTKDNEIYLAVCSYKDAIHEQCSSCHDSDSEKTDIEIGPEMPDECTDCHSNEL